LALEQGVQGAAKAKEDYKTTKVSKIPSSRFYSDVTINPSTLLVNPEGSFPGRAAIR